MQVLPQKTQEGYSMTQYTGETLPVEAPEDRVFEDYWGFNETNKFFFPDGVSYIEYKTMTEGDKQQYQKLTKRDMSISRQTGDAKLAIDQAEDRNALLQVACVGWNLHRNGSPVTFSNTKGGTFNQWVLSANPRIVDELEKAIRMANPWLLGDMKSEDIQKQIDDLQDMLKLAQEREAGNAS